MFCTARTLYGTSFRDLKHDPKITEHDLTESYYISKPGTKGQPYDFRAEVYGMSR